MISAPTLPVSLLRRSGTTRSGLSAALASESNSSATGDVETPESAHDSTGAASVPGDDERDGQSPDGESEGEDETAPRLPLDVVFDILKNRRRRLILRYLRRTEGPAEIGELAEHIAAVENEKTVAEIGSKERKRVYVCLYQCHFPKMEDADAIVSDRNLGVELGPTADQLYRYLDRSGTAPDRAWHRYYGGVAAGAAALLAAGWLAPSLPADPAVSLAALVAGIGVTAAAQARDARRDGE